MAAWGLGARFVGPARLDGFRLGLTRRSIRWGGGVLDLLPAPGEHVWGALYELPEASLEELDRKEGAGFAYRRVQVEVSVEGDRLAATGYAVIDKEHGVPRPTPEYAALVLDGARERGLPADWVARLAALLDAGERPPGAGSVQRPHG
jgi:cation transport regulator ChaC